MKIVKSYYYFMKDCLSITFCFSDHFDTKKSDVEVLGKPSWKPGFETHLFHTTTNEFRLMHTLPRRQMNHGYCPNFHDGKQITRTASFPTCVPYPLERPNWITFLNSSFNWLLFAKIRSIFRSDWVHTRYFY
ncbi:hypothetical protein BD560DRAFT_494106 [Blakeslea trispora]|nr:hypothetical protein BD560DRAFT_494106 [Blakeslea trispora]